MLKWAKPLGEKFFLKPSHQKIFSALEEITHWMYSQNYTPSAINEFTDTADHFLLAHAYALSAIVVTHEVLSQGKKEIKIPNVCKNMDVRYVTPYTMLRQEKAYFILKEK